MMRLNLLLGVGSGPPAPLGLHFWLRAVEAGLAFVVGLALLNWFMGSLRRPARGPWGGGGLRRRRAVRSGSVLLTPVPDPAHADEGEVERRESPSVSMSGCIEGSIAWNFNKAGNGVAAFRGFDARHGSFALSNAVLETSRAAGAASGSLAARACDTPAAPRSPERRPS